MRLENHLFPNWKQQKTHLVQQKASHKTKKMKKKFEKLFFSKNVFGKSYSAENTKEGTLWGFYHPFYRNISKN